MASKGKVRPRWNIERTSPDVITIRFNDVRQGWEQWLLLTSDRHWDSMLSDHDLQEQHMEEAERRDALIFDFGDALDVMQTPSDPRQSKSELDPRDKTTAYLDSVVERFAKWAGRWGNRWVLMAMGNHETQVLKRHNTNLTDRVAEHVRKAGGVTLAGKYHGWVRFVFTMRGTVSQNMALYYHHGSGGAPIMTHGTLDTRRMASWIDADVIVHGHTHTQYVLSLGKLRLNHNGHVRAATTDFVRVPGYKRIGEWEIERGHPVKPLGAVWMRLRYDGTQVQREFTPDLRMGGGHTDE